MNNSYKDFIITSLRDISKVALHKRSKQARMLLFDYVLNQDLIEGMYLEFGVFNCESLNYLSSKTPDNTWYGFDSFKGFVDPNIDNRQDWITDKFDLDKPPISNSNTRLVDGYIEDTLGLFLGKHTQPAALIHLDVDVYSTTKYILEMLRPRLVPGTVIIFDELLHYINFESHEMLALYESLSQYGIEFEWLVTPGEVMPWHNYEQLDMDMKMYKKRADHQISRQYNYQHFIDAGYYRQVAIRIC